MSPIWLYGVLSSRRKYLRLTLEEGLVSDQSSVGGGSSPEGFRGAFPRCVGRRCSPAGSLSSEGLRPVRHLEFRRAASLVRATERGLPGSLTHGKGRVLSPLEQRLIRVGVFNSCTRTEITGSELNPRPFFGPSARLKKDFSDHRRRPGRLASVVVAASSRWVVSTGMRW